MAIKEIEDDFMNIMTTSGTETLMEVKCPEPDNDLYSFKGELKIIQEKQRNFDLDLK